MEERLQKVMAELGFGSRRKCEELIAEGLVTVNGTTVTALGTKVDKDRDLITVEGINLEPLNDKVYILLNKPRGYITSVKDQFGRPTVLDLVKEIKARLFPVGRLDYDTEGLLLLTNDGELTYKLTHPKHHIDKTYQALVKGKITQADIDAFQKGIVVDGYKTAPACLEIIKIISNNSLVNITIHEGRNRQVRKMCSNIGHDVIRLKRIQIGKVILGDLPVGQWRYITNEELDYFKKI